MINPKISHHGLDGWVVWSEKLFQFFVDDPVRDNEGCLVTVHYQACCGEVGPEVLPCLDGALRQMDWICVVAIKANVVNPSIEVEVRERLLEAGEDGLQKGLGEEWSLGASSCYARCGMEPGAEFTLGQNGLVSSVHLHGEL